MSLETDLLLDRRRLKRRLLLWRVLALVAVLLAILAAWRPGATGRAHVARLSIDGMITADAKRSTALRRLADDDTARALIVSIDSPGGTTGAGEELHALLSAVAAKKPVVAVMRGEAASAGYMVALPAARIFARGGTITGSIGVLLPTGEASGLLAALGITTEMIVSGPLKDQPALTHPTSDAGRAVLQGLVDDLYAQFIAAVAAARGLPLETVRGLADGRPYTGRQALALGLIDAIGGEAEARAWLESTRGIAASLPVRDIPRPGVGGLSLEASLTSAVKTVLSQALKLDGPVSLWQGLTSAR